MVQDAVEAQKEDSHERFSLRPQHLGSCWGDVSFRRSNTLKMKLNIEILVAAEAERRDERRP